MQKDSGIDKPNVHGVISGPCIKPRTEGSSAGEDQKTHPEATSSMTLLKIKATAEAYLGRHTTTKSLPDPASTDNAKFKRTLLICDMSGDTFDISLVTIEEASLR